MPAPAAAAQMYPAYWWQYGPLTLNPGYSYRTAQGATAGPIQVGGRLQAICYQQYFVLGLAGQRCQIGMDTGPNIWTIGYVLPTGGYAACRELSSYGSERESVRLPDFIGFP